MILAQLIKAGLFAQPWFSIARGLYGALVLAVSAVDGGTNCWFDHQLCNSEHPPRGGAHRMMPTVLAHFFLKRLSLHKKMCQHRHKKMCSNSWVDHQRRSTRRHLPQMHHQTVLQMHQHIVLIKEFRFRAKRDQLEPLEDVYLSICSILGDRRVWVGDPSTSSCRVSLPRADKRVPLQSKEGATQNCLGRLSERHRQNLAWTVIHVPYSATV